MTIVFLRPTDLLTWFGGLHQLTVCQLVDAVEVNVDQSPYLVRRRAELIR